MFNMHSKNYLITLNVENYIYHYLYISIYHNIIKSVIIFRSDDMSTAVKQTYQSVCQYSLVKTQEYVENEKVVQYGIEQTYESLGQPKEKTLFHNISQDKHLVESLIGRLEDEDVQPQQLTYIVEDYLNEVFGL